MEDTRNRKYQDTGCSVIVEAPPGYQNEPSSGDPGSSDDMTSQVTDQQALVHREEIPEDRSSGERARFRFSSLFWADLSRERVSLMRIRISDPV